MTDSKYFTTTKKGEIFELKAELNSDKKDKKKEAVKKVIASMTVGKDVSALFPDVVNCIQTDNLELKKLVYLYLMNYAKSQPDMAIMAVNTFVKDCDDSNPLIRALAVRTMGCIRVDKIIDYLCDPLRKCLKDEDPYVVANAVAAISEISESSPAAQQILELNSNTVNKLLTALNECTEPEILKNEMKVFFVKYNDPIFVKLEKLDIMIRLTNQGNIAQVLAELKEASMIWIIGEYAERIDNADELLESFLDGFQDENAQDSDNPDLRDRGYIYWRLLSTDPAAAKEVVLAEKPLISEETDLIEPTLLDELICHIASLASVYHKPPNAFVEGRASLRKILPPRSQSGNVDEENAQANVEAAPPQTAGAQPTVIPGVDSLIGDLLDIDLGGPSMQQQQQMYGSPAHSQTPVQGSGLDILGEGLDSLNFIHSYCYLVNNYDLRLLRTASYYELIEMNKPL
ncbi:hypothetical protein KUTeg_009723 [Tegillarca granosa]|uniref:Clathrin/coatomer adaptor adaptin-like N-terminal domain-containing protein n=1 Tax=Tegillarca granosa TaxID=220873 RepID=A0ABQ9F4Q2_TEGGR|nr:hypothetical protein KUTeg_009723 [Tegillarca granosa]